MCGLGFGELRVEVLGIEVCGLGRLGFRVHGAGFGSKGVGGWGSGFRITKPTPYSLLPTPYTLHPTP